MKLVLSLKLGKDEQYFQLTIIKNYVASISVLPEDFLRTSLGHVKTAVDLNSHSVENFWR